MCPSAPRVCSEPGGQKPVLSLSLDLIGGATFLHMELTCGEKFNFELMITPRTLNVFFWYKNGVFIQHKTLSKIIIWRDYHKLKFTRICLHSIISNPLDNFATIHLETWHYFFDLSGCTGEGIIICVVIQSTLVYKQVHVIDKDIK